MDSEIYCEILAKRGQDPLAKEDNHEYNDGIMAFRHDLQMNKVLWHNDWKKDWICWQRNNHALYAIFAAPKYHEFSRRERAVTFACTTVIFSLAAALAVTAENYMKQGGQSALTIFMVTNVINLVGGITAGITEGILKTCATCPCVQEIENESLTKRMERLGHLFMLLWTVSSIIFMIGGGWLSVYYGLLSQYIVAWFTGVIASLIVPTLLLTVVFHFMWKKQSQKLGNDSPFMVCATEYNEIIVNKQAKSSRTEFPDITDVRKVKLMQISMSITILDLQFHTCVAVFDMWLF